MVRLCLRIARELHMPITAALELPGRELAFWAAVLEAEAKGEPEPTPPEEIEVDPREVYKRLGGTIK